MTPTIRITLDDPRFDPAKPIVVNGVLFVPARPVAGRLLMSPAPKPGWIVEARLPAVVKASFG